MDQHVQAAHDVADALGKQYMESLFAGTYRFYVDIEFMIDFRLSALLCLMTESDYDIVKKHMAKYNARWDMHTVKYFPGISVTEEAIDAYLKEPTNLSMWTNRLQCTTYFDVYLDLLKGNFVKNHLSGSEGLETFEVTIGCNDLPLPRLHRELIVNRILEYTRNEAQVSVTRQGIKDYSASRIERTQHFSLYDLQTVLASKGFATNVESGLFNGRSINAFPILYTPDDNFTPVQQFNETSERLNLFFDFEYITTKVRHG